MFVKLVSNAHPRSSRRETSFIFECSAVRPHKFTINTSEVEEEDRVSARAHFDELEENWTPEEDFASYLPFGMPGEVNRYGPTILVLTPDKRVNNYKSVAVTNASCYIMSDDGKTIDKIRV